MPWEKILKNLCLIEGQFHTTGRIKPFVDYLALLHRIFERSAQTKRPLDNVGLLLLVAEYNDTIKNLPENIIKERGFYRFCYRAGRGYTHIDDTSNEALETYSQEGGLQKLIE